MLTGCSGPAAVSVPLPSASPTLTAEQKAACRALLAALPGELDPGVERRTVEPETVRTAAWGDPPVVLTCGVEAPDPNEAPFGVNGVDWSVRDIGDGFRWTTLGRQVDVGVDIPGSYQNSAELVNPLAEPIRSALPQRPGAADPLAPPAPSSAQPSPAS